ncbi:major facilitator superfamily-like protein [Fragilaria crotonensis]|nr:major facilitator superfamily-like protein [Fragilaria crotonensis]
MPPQSHPPHQSDDEEQQTIETQESSAKVDRNGETPFLLHPTFVLPLLVMIDMFSVSLVVPLLMQYYTDAGVTSASQRELLSSIFSSSQIVGGLLLGALADARILRRRTILFLSFGGSALAYALIVYGNIAALIVSRILVGLVKQTMTVSTTMVARYTTVENRAKHMGRLNACSTMAWIVGPSVGALLYKTVDVRAPVLVAAALFVTNMILAAMLLPSKELGADEVTRNTKTSNKFSSFASDLKECFSSPVLASAIISMLLFTWVTRATSYATMASYYEQMFGMEAHHRGYLSSYQQTLSFLVQSFLVAPMIKWSGDERRAATYAAMILAIVTFLEANGNLYVFLLFLAPAVSLSMSVMSLSLSTLITHVAPKESLGSVLAALDVLQNVSAVTVPFYRTILFSLLGGEHRGTMQGDPEPIRWVISSGAHWFIAAVAMGFLLLKQPTAAKDEKKTI